ncbi:MFS transporter [Lactobacillus sp. YT155]|uniref:MFS transporter n=1 Tax=Lactobacillus sp. YT155 TaxID=3060955 RepID=UPI00265FE726|nr:MFS transporter [Lactobacillus sp. YT155]MDO1604961.1 MFS transporter [Lactobacillus sp. YT155]
MDNKNNEFATLSLFERISYGAGDFAQNLVFGTVGGFLLFYLSTVNGISAAAGATIFLVVRIVNVFWDPWVGAFVDKRNPKNGKYRPYILWFGLPLVIFAGLLFLPIPFQDNGLRVGYAFVSYLATALTYSFVNIPYGALSASLTRDNEQISLLTTTRMTMANTANLLVYTLFPLFVQMLSPNARQTDTGLFGLKLNLGDYGLHSASGAWFKVYGVYMVLGLAALLLTYFGVKERIVPTKEETDSVKYSDLAAELVRNKPLRILGAFFLVGFTFMFFGNTVWPFYMQYNIGHSEWMASIGLIGSIPGILLVFLWPIVRKWLGKKQFFYAFLAIFILGSFVLWIWGFSQFKNSPALGYLGRFLQQWGLTSATGYMWAMVPEVVSYGEYNSKKRVAGIINALMGLFFKLGLALGGIIPGYINAFFQFDGQAKTQSANALMGLQVSMIWIPIVLAVVAMIIMSRYPLSDKEVDEINLKLQDARNGEK